MTEPARLLDWDTEFWGFPVGRVTGRIAGEEAALEEWIRDHGVRCLYLQCARDDVSGLQAAQDFGFRIIDARFDYEAVMKGGHAQQRWPIRHATDNDLPALTTIARCAHHDSRFFVDPHFPEHRSADLYEAWIVKSIHHAFDDWAIVVDINDQPAGYVTGRQDAHGLGRIGLIAVAEEHRGRHVGSALVAGALDRFASQTSGSVRAATQARNLAAHRLYQGCGFGVAAISYDLHWWRAG